MSRYPAAALVSCVIPWDRDQRLMEDLFRRSVRHTLQHFNHVYIFGTAGEGYAVTNAQFRRIVNIFYEETRGDDIHPMVGVIGMSTPIIVEKIQFAYDTGFRAFQISLPPWGALTDAEIMTFFQDVCGSFPNAQFLHYNLPRTGRVLEADDYRPLIKAIPNLVATKNTAGGLRRASELVSKAGELQHFLGEDTYIYGRHYGECSLLATFGPMTPQKSKEYFAAGLRGDIRTLMALKIGYHDLLQDLFAVIGELKYIDGAYDKLWFKLGGMEEMPLRLLSPYHAISEEIYMACRQMVHEKYSEWISQ